MTPASATQMLPTGLVPPSLGFDCDVLDPPEVLKVPPVPVPAFPPAPIGFELPEPPVNWLMPICPEQATTVEAMRIRWSLMVTLYARMNQKICVSDYVVTPSSSSH